MSPWRIFIVLLAVVSLCAVTARAAGNTGPSDNLPDMAVLLDGLSVLADAPCRDESTALVILKSDVELEALLMLVRQFGADFDKQTLDARIRLKARRVVVLTRMLAKQSRQIGEGVAVSKRAGALARLTEKAGGAQRMRELLERCDATPADLERWVEDSILAVEQIEYLKDRIDPPTEQELQRRFQAGGHVYAGLEYAKVKSRYRKLIVNMLVQQALDEWLKNILKSKCIRIIH